MATTHQEPRSIWELQEQLRAWHDQEYRKAYPDSEFITGQTLASHGTRAWDELTQEEQEHKERLAYKLNCMLFSIGVSVSDNFREEV